MNDQKQLFSFLLSLSIFLHIGFYFLSMNVWVSSGMEIEKDIQKAFQMRDITFHREVKRKDPVYQVKKIQFPNLRKEILQEAQKLIFDNAPYDTKLVEGEKDVLRDPGIKKSMNFFEAVEDVPDVLYAVESQAKEDILIAEKLSFITSREGFETSEGIGFSDLEGRVKQRTETEDRMIHSRVNRLSYASNDELEYSGSFLNKSKSDLSSSANVSSIEGRMLYGDISAADVVSKLDNMDDLISVSVDHTYFEEEGFGYFQMELKLKKLYTGLKAFPKDVIFVLDISRSMEDEQVRKITDAIKRIVSYELESGDRFNVVLFSQKNEVFSEELVAKGFEDWDQKLQAFFRNVTSRGQTDVYGSLSQIMDRWGGSDKRAGIILLVSDGRSTRGIQEPSEMIRKITVLNKKWRIYCFGNERADKDLLDMLSYMNRGYSSYTGNFIRMDREMIKLFEEIRNPVVLNVKFQHTGRNIENVFPLVIPDLFEKGRITFYGKYRSRESVFTGRITGETMQGQKEIVFLDRFESLSESEGGESLKKSYERAKSFEERKPTL